MQLTQGKRRACFISVGIGNLSDFAMVKSLCKLRACLVDNNTLLF